MADPDVGQLQKRITTLENRADQMDAWKGTTLKFLDQEQKRADADEKQTAKNIQTLVKKFAEIDAELKRLANKVKDNADNTEGNRQALLRARKYVDGHDASADKKIENLKKLMDDMEKRHVKLVDTQIKNYDRLIRKIITQEVAKVGKGRR